MPENAGVFRLEITNPGNVPGTTVGFFTKDGFDGFGELSGSNETLAARAGVDYQATRGSITFEGAQTTAIIKVPILDNGIVDGPRHFSVVLTDTAGVEIGYGTYPIRIEDNEASPMVWPGADGSFDFAHRPRVAGHPVVAFADGGSWTWVPFWESFVDEAGLYRLSPSGDIITKISLPEPETTCWGGLDGSIYILRVGADPGTVLWQRLTRDGLPDSAFRVVTISPNLSPKYLTLTFQADGKILVTGFSLADFNGEPSASIVRLNQDGSLDRSFQTAFESAGIFSVLPQAEGKLLLSGYFYFGTVDGQRVERDGVIRLNRDGELDSSFAFQRRYDVYPTFVSVNDWVLLDDDSGGIVTLSRLRDDGSRDPNFRLDLSMVPAKPGQGGPPPAVVTATPQGDVLIQGALRNQPGVPHLEGGLRVRPNASPGFRVIQSSWFHRPPGEARLQILRSGDTTQPASVDFATRDGSARAGDDYLERRGTLDFAPLEVSKEIVIPLLAPKDQEPRQFHLELSEPSVGYVVTSPATVQIAQKAQIVPESLRLAHEHASGRNYVELAVRYAMPGSYYHIEYSKDLKQWHYLGGGAEITSRSMEWLSAYVTDPPIQFFRVVEDDELE